MLSTTPTILFPPSLLNSRLSVSPGTPRPTEFTHSKAEHKSVDSKFVEYKAYGATPTKSTKPNAEHMPYVPTPIKSSKPKVKHKTQDSNKSAKPKAEYKAPKY
jgi:hypothetical protein